MTDKELLERIEYLENKLDLLTNFVYEFFYNHHELLNEDDCVRLRAIIEFKENKNERNNSKM